MGYGWNGDGWGWGSWLIMAMIMVIFWGAIIIGIVMAVRYTRQERHNFASRTLDDRHDPALRLLEERFARGEIDADEYVKRRDILRPR